MSAGAPLWPGVRAGCPLDVVGVGECSLDHVALVDGLPPLGGKRRIQEYVQLPGGQVATALLACARLGLRAALIGSVGDDAAGAAVLGPLREAGIDLAGVRRVAGAPSRLALILVDRGSGERTVLWYRDPRLSLEVASLRREDVERGRVLYVDASDPEFSTWAARIAREAGIPVVLDADAVAPGIERLLRHVDFPIVSREFAATWSGSAEPGEALRRLAALGARLPVVTLGSEGAVAWWEDAELPSPSFAVDVRDTTGAGDVFHAGFVFALLRGCDARETLRVANAAAAMNCRALGAQGGLPGVAELEAFLAAARSTVEPEPRIASRDA
jgi:sulfofructose kinase